MARIRVKRIVYWVRLGFAWPFVLLAMGFENVIVAAEFLGTKSWNASHKIEGLEPVGKDRDE